MAQNLLDTDSFGGTAGTELRLYSADWPFADSNIYFTAKISTPNGGFCCFVGGTAAANRRTGQTWTNDQWAEVTLAGNFASNYCYIGVRLTDADSALDGYFGGYDPAVYTTNRYRLVKIVNGTVTELANSATTATLGDVVNVEAVGTAVTLRLNGSILLTTTDGDMTSGVPGLRLNDGTTDAKLAGTWRAGSVTAAAADQVPYRPLWHQLGPVLSG